jgi:hypothetical protein
VETLSGLAMGGGLQVELGSAAHLISHFWQGRNERFHEKERRAFFSRLFGSDEASSNDTAVDPDTNFESLMIGLCESLYKLDDRGQDQNYGSPEAQARVRYAVQNVVENLIRKGGGLMAFAAGEILNTIQESIQILQQPPVKQAFEARTLWDVVRAIGERYKQARAAAQNYVGRGKAGMTVLSWVADSLGKLGNASVPIVTLDNPVVAAAEEWLQSSLAIRETGATGTRDAA